MTLGEWIALVPIIVLGGSAVWLLSGMKTELKIICPKVHATHLAVTKHAIECDTDRGVTRSRLDGQEKAIERLEGTTG